MFTTKVYESVVALYTMKKDEKTNKEKLFVYFILLVLSVLYAYIKYTAHCYAFLQKHVKYKIIIIIIIFFNKLYF